VKLALISDIHGNAVALQAVLEEIRKEGVDQIVCLGDVAAMGAQPRECVRLLQELGCPVVQGNTDAALLDRQPLPEDASEHEKVFWEIDGWAAEQLTREDRAFVATFQPTVEVPLGDGEALLAFHGSPRSHSEIILPTTPDEALAEILAGATHVLLAGGHTHRAMVRRFGRSWLINPGSVGLPFDRVPPATAVRHPGWAEYAIVTWSPDRKGVDLRRVHYPVAEYVKALRACDMPHKELLLADWDEA